MSPFEVTIEAAAFLSGELSSSTVVKNGFGNLRQSEFERKYLDFFPLSLSLSLSLSVISLPYQLGIRAQSYKYNFQHNFWYAGFEISDWSKKLI